MQYGVLYIVSTPIGNLEDITLRALKVLKEVSLIAVEDTRHSLKLLNHFSIKKPLISCWSEKEKNVSHQIITKLKQGATVALITDAGTPGISDPGSYIIKEAIKEGIRVIPIPGASALITAICASGLDCDEFRFIGFLPSKKSQREKKLQSLVDDRTTIIFYEAPHRLIESLKDMLDILGDRNAVIAKEMTKLNEEFIRDTLSGLCDKIPQMTIAGEYVIVVEGAKPKEASIDEAIFALNKLMSEGISRKEASKKVAHQFGLKSKTLYDYTLNPKVSKLIDE